jgi:NYN domain
MRGVYVFWDNSNIFIPAHQVADQREGIHARRDIRIQFDNLFKLAKGGRPVAQAVCVGSVPPELQAVWVRLRKAGVSVELYERGAESGREQGIDQCLQVHMLRALTDASEPSVAVLLTGDGAGYLGGRGYHADLERMANKGWGVEVLSWDIACNGRLRDWAKQAGVYIPLEDYYKSITFCEGGRTVSPLSLKRRAYVPIPSQGVNVTSAQAT